MSNLKKIIIAIVMTFILALGFAVTVNAKTNAATPFGSVNWSSVSVKDKILISRDDYTYYKDLYCIQRGDHLHNEKINYTISSIIEIDGRKGLDHKGNNWTCDENAVLAYILHQGISDPSNKSSEPGCNAVWTYIDTWLGAVKGHLKGIDGLGGGQEGDGEESEDDLKKAAKNYAADLNNYNEGIVDMTNKENLKVTTVQEGEYIRIGPFDYNIQYELCNMKISVENKNDSTKNHDVNLENAEIVIKSPNGMDKKGSIKALLDSDKDEFGNKGNGINDLTDIIKNNEFWIRIPNNTLNSGFTKITIKPEMSIKKYKAKIWFLRSEYQSWQNLIRKQVSNYDDSKAFEFSYEPPTTYKLNISKRTKPDDTPLGNVGFIVKYEGKGYLSMGNPDWNYTSSPSQATVFYTDSAGNISLSNLELGNYTAYEIINPNPGFTTSGLNINTSSEANLIYAPQGSAVAIPYNMTFSEGNGLITLYNPRLGNLLIEKTILDPRNDSDTGIGLGGVGFVLQCVDNGQYVIGSTGNFTYTNNLDARCIYYSDSKGELYFEGLIPGDYQIFEVSNPHYGYDTTGSIELTPVGLLSAKIQRSTQVKSGETTTERVGNKQKYIKLSGYVWLDKPGGKDSKTNNLYDANIDEKFAKYKVMLCEVGGGCKDYKNGTDLGDDKKWTFENVDVAKLLDGKYYIEYLYDGLVYENVDINLNADNGSKASEDKVNTNNDYERHTNRQTFNNYFQKIEGIPENPNGISHRHDGKIIGSSGNQSVSVDITYKNKKNEKNEDIPDEMEFVNNGSTSYAGIGSGLAYEHIVMGSWNGLYAMYANTNNAGYYLKDNFSWGIEEIHNINLGLYERAQPNLAIGSDIYNVKLSINGYNHIYKYANALNNSGEFNEDMFNVGVKFGFRSGNDDVTNYTQAIYKSDYDYKDPNPNTPENHDLEVFVTYVVKAKNKSSGGLGATINSFIDYYDNRYELVCVSNEIDEATGLPRTDRPLTKTNLKDFGNYKTVKIESKSSEYIEAGSESKPYYLEFKLSKEAVGQLLNNKDTEDLSNIVEINSYSVFKKDDKYGQYRNYAGIDKDSAPTDAVVLTPDARKDPEVAGGIRKYWQDDTHESAGLKLEIKNARTIEGIVFLDKTTGEPRVGNGMYDNGEEGIGGVEIVLTETTGSGKEYKTGTESSGNDKGKFMIQGYIPGKYILTYKWGDNTYTVQDYENTIYNTNRSDNPPKNTKWYKEEDPRYSDAIDNYNTKQTAPYGSRLQIDDELKNVTNTSEITRHKIESSTYPMEFDVENSITTTSNYGDKLVYEIKNIDFGIARRAEQKILLTKRIKTMKVTLENGQVIADLSIDEDPANGKRRTTGSKANVTYMEPGVNIIPENGFIKLEVDNELLQGTKLEIGYSISIKNQSELDYTNETWYKYKYDKSNLVIIKDLAVMDYLDKGWSFDKNDNPGWEIKTKDEIKNLVSKDVYEDELSTISEKQILYKEDDNLNLEPNQTQEMTLNVSKLLTTTEEISLDNETEVVKIVKTGGSKILTTPGNYVPGKGHIEPDDDMAETTIVTPSTGENQNYIMIITVVITALIILGVGVVIIKKKVINKNKADKS